MDCIKKGGILLGFMLMASVATVVAAGSAEVVVDRFQAAYRDGSVEGMLDLYAADATFEDVNQRHLFTGTQQLQAMLMGLVGVHHEMDLVEMRRVVAGDTVVVESLYKGELNGAVLGASVGKEGCPDLGYEIPVTSWFQVKGGKISRQKDFLDWATFLELRQKMLAAGKDASQGEDRR